MDLKTWNCYLEEVVGAVERRRPVDPSQDPQFINVKSLIKQQKTLDPQLWDNEKLKPEIVDRLIQIARKFFKSLDIGPDTLIKDITLTGSLASFNWSDYSDVDLHILLDFNQFQNPDLVKDLVRSVASNWNNKHDIKMKGYEVEIYVQDANEPHHSLGVYSLLNNRFLKTPQKFMKKIDGEAVKEKANDLMEKIDNIYDNYAEQQYDLAEKRADYIIKKIRNYRRAGLEQDGPYSIENLVFKVLRRNGYIKKVIDLKTNSYDKRMSVNYDTKLYEAVARGKDKVNILISGNSQASGLDSHISKYFKSLRNKKYNVTSIAGRDGKGGEPKGLLKKLNDYEDGDIDVLFHFGIAPRHFRDVGELFNRYKQVANKIVILDSPKTNYPKGTPRYNNRQRINRITGLIVNSLFPGSDDVVYFSANDLAAIIGNEKNYKDDVHLTTKAYGDLSRLIFNDPRVELFITDTKPVSKKAVGTDDGVTPLKDQLPPTGMEPGEVEAEEEIEAEEEYERDIATGDTSPEDTDIRKGTFLRSFRRLNPRLMPQKFANFMQLYKKYQQNFGDDWEDELLPVHGMDFIFGPEHFAATTRLAQQTKDGQLLNILKNKNFRGDSEVTKAATKKSYQRASKASPVEKISSPLVSDEYRKRFDKPPSREVVRQDVERAASGASGMERDLLFAFLNIESSGGNPNYTFYNPALKKYIGDPNRPAHVGYVDTLNPRRIIKKGSNASRTIGSFQMLRQYDKERQRKYGYNPGLFGDPYHQAQYTLNFIRKKLKRYGDDPVFVYLSWNQGGGGASLLRKYLYSKETNDAGVALKDLPIDDLVKNHGFPGDGARRMKGNYSGSKPLTVRNFVNRYVGHLKRAGLDISYK